MYDRWRIANFHRDINDMPMVGQIDRLSAAADGLHDATSSAGAVFVKGFKDVVAKEGKSGALGHKLIMGGGAKREVELEPRALRHLSRAFAGAVGREYPKLCV